MKILYVCNDLAYWTAHRAGMAGVIAERGHLLALITGVADKLAADRAQGRNAALRPVPGADAAVPGGRMRTVPLDPQRLTVLADLRLARAIREGVAAFRPDVVHLITLKPILYGSLALRAGATSPRVIATFAGLGRVFAADPPDARQRLILRALRTGFQPASVTAAFENEADRARLVAAGTLPLARTAVVPGAGFDPAAFPLAPIPAGPGPGQPIRCLFASRMLRSKGVGQIIEAAGLLRAEGLAVEITLAGPGGADADAVPPEDLAAAARAGLIRHLGPVPSDRMADLIGAHHLLLLPTRYPEGTPRILAEAGAVGRGAIVSDHPGCTAFVRDGTEGVVLDAPMAPALAGAIRALAADPGRIARMGAAAHARALAGFTNASVADAYLRLYDAPASASPETRRTILPM